VQVGEEVPSVLGVGEKFPGFSLIANVGVQQETAFTNLTDQDLRDFWKLYFFWPKDFAPLALTELVAFAALDYELLPSSETIRFRCWRIPSGNSAASWGS
jgi:hypothetical protein